MNKSKIFGIIIILTLFITLGFNTVYGASATIKLSANSVLQGNTFTASISFSSDVCAANYVVSYDTSKLTLVSGDTSVAWAEGESIPSYTFKAKTGVTGGASISLSGTSSDTNFNKSTLSGSGSVTITAPVVQQPTQPSTPSTPTTTKSSNAKLKRLVPDFEGLSPNFNPDVTKYTLIVPSTADSIHLSVAVAESGAKYWVTGDDNLKLGDNTVTVTVTAPDGTKKTYTIIVTKADDVKKANALLSNIIVDGNTLSPAFASETLEYDIGTVSADIEEILVLAYAQAEGAKVEITGDKKLVDGENIIKIKVTAEDGVTIKEYSIKLIKEAKPIEMPETIVGIYEEDSLQEPPSKFKVILDTLWAYLKEFWLVLALFAACLIELWEIIHLYKKVKVLEGPKVKLDKVEDIVETDKPRRRGNAVENATVVEESENIDNSEDNMQEGVVEDISDELVDDSEEVVQDTEDITDNFEDTIDEEENN